jgi:hypothetical protein
MTSLELIFLIENSREWRNSILSVKNIINYWTISGPKEIKENVENELLGIPGRYNENNILDLSQKTCDYQLILRDAQVLVGGEYLKPLLTGPIVSLYFKTPVYYHQNCCIIQTNKNIKFKGTRCITENMPINYIFDPRIFVLSKMNVVEIDNRDDDTNDPYIIYHLAKLNHGTKKSLQLYNKLKGLTSIDREYNFIAEYSIACIEYDDDPINGLNLFQDKMIDLQKRYPERLESYYRLCCILYEYKNFDILKNIVNSLITFPIPKLYVTDLNIKIYDYYIPYIAIETNIKTGNIKDAALLLQKTLQIYPYDQPLLNIKYELCEKPKNILKLDQKIIVIHMGDFEYTWNPKTELKISGSEYMAMNMAKEFAKKDYNVFVFGNFEGEGVDYQQIDEDVQYLDCKVFTSFATKYYIDYLIVSRYTQNLVYYNNINQVYLWVHDITPLSGEHNIFFQTHPKKFKGVITVSNWHKSIFMLKTGIPENMVIVSRNAIYKERFKKVEKKIPYRFIYMSDATRGLNNLVDMIPKIKERYPQTTLVIYCKIEDVEDKTLKKIKTLEYITINPRTTQDTISLELLKSDVWLYPTEFKETYCISALEAMAAGCLVATVKLAGLIDTVGDRGITINPDESWDLLLERLFNVLDDPDEKNRYISNAAKWALDQTYEKLVIEWENFF